MTQEVKTALMVGGLDLATPPIAMPPGKAIAAVNYEPDMSGYTSHPGYERFDGNLRPSDTPDPAGIANRRAAIKAVPGTGPVRGVWVFGEDVYAFRDQVNGTAGMFKAGPSGWAQQVFGVSLEYAQGSVEFFDNEVVGGTTSGATGMAKRVVVREGVWNGTASGYMILSNVVGTFRNGEVLTGQSGGVANAVVTTPIIIKAGGKYDFTNHNFYGASSASKMYFANGADTAFEWSGTTLVPIFTGVSDATPSEVSKLHDHYDPSPAYVGEPILAANGDTIIMSASFDAPAYVSHFANHLFLAFANGTILNSALGEPLEYDAGAGAGETSFGDQITGMLGAANTSLLITAKNRIEYLTGTDNTTWTLNPLSDASGAQPYTLQMMDTPMFLDDGGIRSLPATSAFGDWRLATVTQQIERLMRQKRDAKVLAVASLRVKAKDQYKLFWADGSGVTVYVGRKQPEVIPFNLPIRVFCACNGEVTQGHGERMFVGCEDGFVYELGRGTSFDGAPIEGYIRLPFNSTNSPNQHTRWMKASFDIECPDDVTLGVAFDVDYARGVGGQKVNVDMDGGAPIVSTEQFANVDWSQPVSGRLERHLSGIGPNIAATIVHNSAVVRQHTISSQTYNFSRRRMLR